MTRRGAAGASPLSSSRKRIEGSVIVERTRSPSTVAAAKRQLLTAAMAASSKAAMPDDSTTRTSPTVASSSTSTRSRTAPASPRARADSG